MTTLEFLYCTALHLLKKTKEIVHIRNANLFGDRLSGVPCCGQQEFGTFDPKGIHILNVIDPKIFLKILAEIGAAHVKGCGHIGLKQLFVIVRRQILADFDRQIFLALDIPNGLFNNLKHPSLHGSH